MDYIAEMLGIEVERTSWDMVEKLPFYITDTYEIDKVRMDGKDCLFLKPRSILGSLSAIKKHIDRLQYIESCPVVLELQDISRHRRQALIKERIPFVVPGKQIYLPFIGILLNERFSPILKEVERLQPSAQEALFYIIYHYKTTFYANDIGKALNVSPMTVTRVIRQLKQIGLVQVIKEHNQNIILIKLSRRELFDLSRPYLTNPCRNVVYIDREQLDRRMLKAGLTALSEKSLLNEPALRTYAIYSRIADDFKISPILVDTSEQIELELWKYDPQKLSFSNMVDPLSLVLTIGNAKDERVEQALEELLEKFWRNIDGTRF